MSSDHTDSLFCGALPSSSAAAGSDPTKRHRLPVMPKRDEGIHDGEVLDPALIQLHTRL